MATFQEWWDENYGEFSGQSVQSKIKMRMAYDVGVEHQLTKVDEQQKRIDELRAEIKKLIEEYKSEEKELELKEWEQSTIYGRIAIELEEALKGGEA